MSCRICIAVIPHERRQNHIRTRRARYWSGPRRLGADRSPSTDATPKSSGAPPPGSPIDACKLVGADDITKLLGKPIEGRPIGAGPQAPACTWENRDTYESVTVEIGNPGTAVNGTLPPPEPGFPEVGTPGPDGTRFVASGMVELPAAGRSNTVQVAVLKLLVRTPTTRPSTSPRTIGPQLPQ